MDVTEASSKATLFEYLQGEPEVALERFHDYADNTLDKILGAQWP